jgi:branched-chain amino acid transport system substrate-binding protein
MKTAVIMSEDAAWTTPLDERIPGVPAEDRAQGARPHPLVPDTTDFTPIFNKIEARSPTSSSPASAMSACSRPCSGTTSRCRSRCSAELAGDDQHVLEGHQRRAEGVITADGAAPGVAVTPKTIPFTEAYQEIRRPPPMTATPPMTWCTSSPTRSSAPARPIRTRWSTALEKTDMSARSAAIQFYGKDDLFTHALKYGPGLGHRRFIQWQNGKQVTIWPRAIANGKISFPASIKTPHS